MAITFRCPKCNQRLRVTDETAGKKARCTCGTIIRVPPLPTTPTPPQSSSAVDIEAFHELEESDLVPLPATPSSGAQDDLSGIVELDDSDLVPLAPLQPVPTAPVRPAGAGRRTARKVPRTLKTPPVLPWYIAYCVMMALMYLIATLAGLVIVGLAEPMAANDPEVAIEEIRVTGMVVLVMSLALAIFYAIAPFLGRKQIAWVYGTIAIGIGLTSACCLPVAIPLLIFWLKPETKRYFGSR